MSAKGHKRIWRLQFVMSALLPKADIGRRIEIVPHKFGDRRVRPARGAGQRRADVINSWRQWTIGSKETAMHMTRFERMALARFFVVGWVAFFGVAIENAQAQPVNPVPPPPAPVFNPSTPNTVPQSRETPVSPGTSSTLPKSEALSPSNGSPPRAVARSHRRSATTTPNVAKARSRHSPRHHRRNLSRGSDGAVGMVSSSAPDYRPPLGYEHGLLCVWRQEWDGYWAPACF